MPWVLSLGDLGAVSDRFSDDILQVLLAGPHDHEMFSKRLSSLEEYRTTGSPPHDLGSSDANVPTTTAVPGLIYFVPSHPSVGERWRTMCHSPGQKVILAGHVIGTAPVEVGGRMVAALHTRLTLFFSGSEKGTNPNDYWVSLPIGLILRQRERVDMSQRAGPLGSVRYTEKLAITLSSVTPIR